MGSSVRLSDWGQGKQQRYRARSAYDIHWSQVPLTTFDSFNAALHSGYKGTSFAAIFKHVRIAAIVECYSVGLYFPKGRCGTTYKRPHATGKNRTSNLSLVTFRDETASTKSLMPLRSSSREKKASRHTGFSLPIICACSKKDHQTLTTITDIEQELGERLCPADFPGAPEKCESRTDARNRAAHRQDPCCTGLLGKKMRL